MDPGPNNGSPDLEACKFHGTGREIEMQDWPTAEFPHEWSDMGMGETLCRICGLDADDPIHAARPKLWIP